MDNTKTPVWFWVVSIIFLLWNGIGILNFIGQLNMTPETLANLPQEQQDLFAHITWWTQVAFGIGVIGGTLGSLGLLLRKASAKTFFFISLAGIFIQTSNNLYHTWGTELFGTVINWFVVLVLSTVLAIKLCDYSIKKGWMK